MTTTTFNFARYNGKPDKPEFAIAFEGVWIYLSPAEFWRLVETTNVCFYRARTNPTESVAMSDADTEIAI